MKQGSEAGDLDRRAWRNLILMQLVCFAAVGIYSTTIQRHLYADGSNIFLMLLKQHKVTGFYPSRYYAHFVTQFPAVFLLRDLGCRNLSLLSFAFGAALYLFPIVCLAITCWAGRETPSPLLVYPLLASSIIFLNVSGFIISESHVAAALVWPILYLILFSRQLNLLRSILLLALTFAATRAYQSFLFLAWPLIFVAVQRGLSEYSQKKPLGAITCFGCSSLLLFSFYVALHSIIWPHDPWSDFFFLQAMRHFKYPPVWFSLLALVSLLWSEFLPERSVPFRVLRRFTQIAGVFAALLPLMGIVGPGYQYYSRVQTIYVPFVLILAVIIKTRTQPRDPLVNRNQFDFQSTEAWRVAAWVCVVAVVFQIGSVIRWDTYRSVVLHELADHEGFINFADSPISGRQLTKKDYPSILLNTYPNQFNWAWALPSLSVTLGAVNTGSVKSVILSPDYELFHPFDPHNPRQFPDLREYGIDMEIGVQRPAEPPVEQTANDVPQPASDP